MEEFTKEYYRQWALQITKPRQKSRSLLLEREQKFWNNQLNRKVTQ